MPASATAQAPGQNSSQAPIGRSSRISEAIGPRRARQRADQPAPLAVGDDVGLGHHALIDSRPSVSSAMPDGLASTGSAERLGKAMPATPAWPPASLPRLFVDQPLAHGAALTLDGAPANYLGDGAAARRRATQVKLFDDRTGEWLGRDRSRPAASA